MRHSANPYLEFQTSFTRGICQRLNTAVIFETGTVESHGSNANSSGPLSYCPADCGGRGSVPGTLHVLAQLTV
jgi:hypothetical protein